MPRFFFCRRLVPAVFPSREIPPSLPHLAPRLFACVSHHRSQALAGFGIAGTPDREVGQDTPHQIGNPMFSLSGPGRVKAGGGVGEGQAVHGSGVELSDLLRATRLRGGGGKGARARSPPLVSRVL